jgi:hypothetical protein
VGSIHSHFYLKNKTKKWSTDKHVTLMQDLYSFLSSKDLYPFKKTKETVKTKGNAQRKRHFGSFIIHTDTVKCLGENEIGRHAPFNVVEKGFVLQHRKDLISLCKTI